MMYGKLFKTVLAGGLAACVVVTGACNSGGNSASPPPVESADDSAARTDAQSSAAPAARELQRDVVSDRLPYAEIDDELVYGYFVFPSDMIEPLPAVVIVHEWWGLTDDIRAASDRLASEGFIVLAVDLYGGNTADSLTVARELMAGVIEDSSAAAQNIEGAIDFVMNTAGAPRIGLLGYGLGGGLVLDSVIDLKDQIDAAVMYYGQVRSDQGKLLPISAPLLGLFGAADRAVSVESVEEFRNALQKLRKNYEIVVYPDAGTDFASPQSRNFDSALAEQAWQKSLEFLKLHLSVQGAT
jgi:carboxymethylenebutenolidase